MPDLSLASSISVYIFGIDDSPVSIINYFTVINIIGSTSFDFLPRPFIISHDICLIFYVRVDFTGCELRELFVNR